MICPAVAPLDWVSVIGDYLSLPSRTVRTQIPAAHIPEALFIALFQPFGSERAYLLITDRKVPAQPLARIHEPRFSPSLVARVRFAPTHHQIRTRSLNSRSTIESDASTCDWHVHNAHWDMLGLSPFDARIEMLKYTASGRFINFAGDSRENGSRIT